METLLGTIENIDEELFVKQKMWWTCWSMREDEYAAGILNLFYQVGMKKLKLSAND